MNEIAKPTDALEQFQDKIKEKIKANIADALPDDVIKQLFNKCVDEQFFQKVEIKGHYGSGDKFHPSWFEKEVVKVAEPVIKTKVEAWFKNNEKCLDKALENYLKPEMLAGVVLSLITSNVNCSLEARIATIEDALRNTNIPV